MPLEKLQDAWDIILDEVPEGDKSAIFEFIRYFMDTWIKGNYFCGLNIQ